MEFVMLFFSAIIIVCIVGNKLSARIGVPSLLIFLALGMICGSDGILKIPFDNYQLSEQAKSDFSTSMLIAPRICPLANSSAVRTSRRITAVSAMAFS